MDEFDTVAPDIPPEFQAPETAEGEEGFPSVRYGPDGQEQAFDSAKDVPPGWKDHPSKVKGAPDPSKEPIPQRRRSRAEIAKDLRLLKIKHEPNASAAQLEKLLIAEQNKAKMEKVREARKLKKPKAPEKPAKKAAGKAAKA